MEVPSQRLPDTNGETEGAISLIARGFLSKADLATDQTRSLKFMTLVLNAVATIAKAYRQLVPWQHCVGVVEVESELQFFTCVGPSHHIGK